MTNSTARSHKNVSQLFLIKRAEIITSFRLKRYHVIVIKILNEDNVATHK